MALRCEGVLPGGGCLFGDPFVGLRVYGKPASSSCFLEVGKKSERLLCKYMVFRHPWGVLHLAPNLA